MSAASDRSGKVTATGPGLLVSARDLAEVQSCWDAGLAVLDLKEPRAGALGAVSRETAAAVVAFLSSVGPSPAVPRLSLAAGELRDWEGACPIDRFGPDVLSALAFFKVGLAGEVGRDWPRQWDQLMQNLPEPVAPVAVAYADAATVGAPPPAEVLDFARQHPRVETLLLDTSGKVGSLFDVETGNWLRSWMQQARAAGLRVVLAGSLGPATLARAIGLGPDLIGVRGAVCRGARDGQLDPEKLRHFLRLIALESEFSNGEQANPPSGVCNRAGPGFQ